MKRASQLKGQGYLASSASVLLLAVPALKSALESPLLLVCLLAGMTLSIVGMVYRWRSHRLEQQEKDAQAHGARDRTAPQKS